ncbi:MAG: M23 family metallopeptidase [Burkholderiales bacterium]|nr:M23 family metallopeptidase [Burkholderiales bacterium]
MNIILVSNRLSKAVTIGPGHLWVLAGFCGLALIGLLTLASWATYSLTRTLGVTLPTLPGTPAAQQRQIDLLAVRLGQMQAQMVRLDGLTRSVAGKTGIDAKPFLSTAQAPQGGNVSDIPSRAMRLKDLQAMVDSSDRHLADTIDQYDAIDAILTQQKLNTWHPPANLPTSTGLRSSLYGWRIDPFNGRQSFHEGVDFVGDIGTPIYAAAGGTVVRAEHHPEYGNMVEIDHGNGITSRYAHASALLVQEGDAVKTGQKIALLGSTGRSTGPHLHFEIRYKGVPQNPIYFLHLDAKPGRETVAAD